MLGPCSPGLLDCLRAGRLAGWLARVLAWSPLNLNVCLSFLLYFLHSPTLTYPPLPKQPNPNNRCNVPVKKLLIPLSFATVFGGTCTLIGTSTNLVVSGLQQEMSKKDPSIPVFNFFTITVSFLLLGFGFGCSSALGGFGLLLFLWVYVWSLC